MKYDENLATNLIANHSYFYSTTQDLTKIIKDNFEIMMIYAKEQDSNVPKVSKQLKVSQEQHPNSVLVIDSGADTSAIAGEQWIVDEISERTAGVAGVLNNCTSNVKIGSAITAVDLPNNTTVLIKVNEATIFGKKDNLYYLLIKQGNMGL